MRKIVLASSSPRRKEILGRTGLRFIVDPADVEENMRQKVRPSELVKRLALSKATTVATRHPGSVVIGADTVVSLGTRIWSKPGTLKEAHKTLRALSGKAHDVWTGFVIIDTQNGNTVAKAVRTRVYFRRLSDHDIKHYLSKGESLDFAGSYAIQLNGSVLIEKIVGDYNNVVGLPLATVLQELERFGIRP